MAEIGQEDVELDHVPKAAARGFRHGGEVIEHPTNLGIDVAVDQGHGDRIERNLAGQIHGIAGADRLRIGADRLRRPIGGNYLLSHGGFSCGVRI